MPLKGATSMIRFRCSHCDKTLKVPEGKAGATVVCPRCQGLSMAAAGTSASTPEGRPHEPKAWGGAVAHRHGDEAVSLFSGMRQGVRWAVALVAGVGVLSLLLAVLAPVVPALAAVGDAATYWAPPLALSSAVVLLVILYGHGTGCPACGKWWARSEVETQFVDRERFYKGGVLFARSTYRTNYACNSCRYTWAVTRTDEHKEFIRDRPKRRLG
jgi:phage FluMu protein Com